MATTTSSDSRQPNASKPNDDMLERALTAATSTARQNWETSLAPWHKGYQAREVRSNGSRYLEK